MSDSNNNDDALQVYRDQEHIYLQDNSKEDEEQRDETRCRSLLLEFISKIRPGVDMYRITVPSIVLEPISFLEKITQFSPPFDFILDATDNDNAEQRFLAVTRWVVSFFRRVPKNALTNTKPYNPILGEIFNCHWDHADGSVTHFLAEQVSHHPPVSAYIFSNTKRGFYYEGTLAPRSKFNGNSASSILEGKLTITFAKHNEQYNLVLPHILARGVVIGNQYMEVNEKLEVTCDKTGYYARIDFKQKANHELSGEIKNKDKVTHKIKGYMNKQIVITDLATKKESVFFELSQVTTPLKKVAPVAEQKPNESRRVWHHATFQLKQKNYEAASAHKAEVEEAQRAITKARKENNEEWQPAYFEKKDDYWVYKGNYEGVPQRPEQGSS